MSDWSLIGSLILFGCFWWQYWRRCQYYREAQILRKQRDRIALLLEQHGYRCEFEMGPESDCLTICYPGSLTPLKEIGRDRNLRPRR